MNMNFIQAHEDLLKIIIGLSLLAIFFTYGIIAGYNPIIGFLLIAGLCFILMYSYYPPLFAYLFVLIVPFSALLNLPVTEGGFSLAVAIAFASFSLGIFGSLMKKDRNLIKIFCDRPDQILPVLFFIFMVVSMMNSKAKVYSVKQIQQFFYLLIIYFFLHLIINDSRTFRKVFFFVFAAGIGVGLLGAVEAVIQQPIYYLLGNKSLLGADVAESLLNAKVGRINGPIGDAPFHGIYMTIISLLCFYFLFTCRYIKLKLLFIPILLLLIFNIIGTGSRGVFISMLLGWFVFWMYAKIPHKYILMGAVLIIGAGLVALVLFVFPYLDITRSFTIDKESSDTIEMRWENIPVAIKMFADHPIIGNGPDGFIINYNHYAAGTTALASRIKTLKTHNTPLQILAEYGLVGISLFSLIIVMAVKRMITVVRKAADPKDQMISAALLGAISAYIFFMVTSNTLLDKHFWLIIILAQIHYTIYRDALKRTDNAAIL